MTRLEELCSLVADVGMVKAVELSDLLGNVLAVLLPEWADVASRPHTSQRLLASFACINWVLAIGAWSGLEDKKLRRDLMVESKKQMALATAKSLNPNGTMQDLAALAVTLDFDEFQPFLMTCIDQWGVLERKGECPDAYSTLLIGLEWTLTHLGLSENLTARIAPMFLAEVGDFASVEDVALQVNRAAAERK